MRAIFITSIIVFVIAWVILLWPGSIGMQFILVSAIPLLFIGILMHIGLSIPLLINKIKWAKPMFFLNPIFVMIIVVAISSSTHLIKGDWRNFNTNPIIDNSKVDERATIIWNVNANQNPFHRFNFFNLFEYYKISIEDELYARFANVEYDWIYDLNANKVSKLFNSTTEKGLYVEGNQSFKITTSDTSYSVKKFGNEVFTIVSIDSTTVDTVEVITKYPIILFAKRSLSESRFYLNFAINTDGSMYCLQQGLLVYAFNCEEPTVILKYEFNSETDSFLQNICISKEQWLKARDDYEKNLREN